VRVDAPDGDLEALIVRRRADLKCQSQELALAGP